MELELEILQQQVIILLCYFIKMKHSNQIPKIEREKIKKSNLLFEKIDELEKKIKKLEAKK